MTITKNFQKSGLWPSLPYNEWNDTLDTLHLWIQIVGKVKLKLSPFLNQWWEVVLYPTVRGLTTGRIPYNHSAFEIVFDFINHTVFILTSNGKEERILLQPMSVATFYTKIFQSLERLDIHITITPTPSEMSDTIPFKTDTTHHAYDKRHVNNWWQIILQASLLFDTFRSTFQGKSSPVQFFWGSFDLNTTRYSGKKLSDKTEWPKGYSFMRYAENEENFAIGFWPGDQRFPNPAFYSYLFPAPKGCESMLTGPAISYFSKTLSECILPYEEVRRTKNPEKEILDFFNTTYNEYTKLAGWDSKELEGSVPR